tara:strand:- start:3066 stop:3218 length:153 start_codon:yes stop_codon:yes gene_type:complete
MVKILDKQGYDIGMTPKEIVQYYGQQWDNVKHLKKYIKTLENRYKNEVKK